MENRKGTGKTALITGASSGIGQELAKLFAQDGYNLVLVARSVETLHRLAEVFELNYGTEQVTVIEKDLSEEDAARDVYEQVQAKGITVDVLVNDAGVGLHGKFATETDWEAEKSMVNLNVLTTTLLTKLYLRDMVARNEGRVLNLASLVSITPFPLMAVYAATKAYVNSLTQSLVNELKGTNVTVTALMPNATDTDFFNKAGAADVVATDMVDDPVMVAKDGYEALMSGKPKVVPGGLVNKAYEVMAYVAPQETMAGMMRYTLTPKHEIAQKVREQRPTIWAVGLGLAAVAVSGIFLATRHRQAALAE
ncbi:SDR family NAD(P)-dependent oxidoreductase [Fibrella sp. HMF5335]|uniref:SDR family NAD(P)-dependent oxidoreductase n=1 Tax=Fibrella rubiginis TaxID=2817060 RepID=A0A939K4M6_9BACT|nr:SDR family NAD(P)-dependent oxidoreductase [Fibrella rubiginis]MBO0936878.1 SDR family NAD(P)-dependent oxidoreductase [Fibrella rubiginis]